MRKFVYAFLALSPFAAEAFSPSVLGSLGTQNPSSPAAISRQGPSLLTLRCSEDRVTRREAVKVLGATSAFFLGAKGAKADEELAPAEDDEPGRTAPRYSRQPTRLDMERTLPKMAPVKDVMDAVKGALTAGDLGAVAKAIGDPSIEATKKNVNLGKDISDLSKAKSFMYRYAQVYSKGKDSALTTDIKTGLDTYYGWMADVREKALAGDKKGAEAGFTSAEGALDYLVDVVEKECRKGRINQIPVSLSFLTGKGELNKNVATFKSNMEEMAKKRKE